MSKPKFGIGQHVMLRFPQRPEWNSEHTIIMRSVWLESGREVTCLHTGKAEALIDGVWAYETSEAPRHLTFERHILARPEPSTMSWHELMHRAKTPNAQS